MRISFGCFVLGVGFLAMVMAVTARGQSELPQVAGGVYGSYGVVVPLSLNLSAGGYVEAVRFRFRPGVEVRATAETAGEAGQGLVMAGPRVSHPLLGGNVYAATLFGPSHQWNSTGTKEISGVTSQVAIGIEKDMGSHLRWRMLELNAGFFSGASGWQTFAVSTGLVLHFH
jgi:hypothetical protein